MHTTKSFDVDKSRESMTNLVYGVVNWFDGDRGFGFVTPTEGDQDVFVDFSEIVDTPAAELHAGRRVSFRAGGTRHWPTAEAVHVL